MKAIKNGYEISEGVLRNPLRQVKKYIQKSKKIAKLHSDLDRLKNIIQMYYQEHSKY